MINCLLVTEWENLISILTSTFENIFKGVLDVYEDVFTLLIIVSTYKVIEKKTLNKNYYVSKRLLEDFIKTIFDYLLIIF